MLALSRATAASAFHLPVFPVFTKEAPKLCVREGTTILKLTPQNTRDVKNFMKKEDLKYAVVLGADNLPCAINRDARKVGKASEEHYVICNPKRSSSSHHSRDKVRTPSGRPSSAMEIPLGIREKTPTADMAGSRTKFSQTAQPRGTEINRRVIVRATLSDLVELLDEAQRRAGADLRVHQQTRNIQDPIIGSDGIERHRYGKYAQSTHKERPETARTKPHADSKRADKGGKESKVNVAKSLPSAKRPPKKRKVSETRRMSSDDSEQSSISAKVMRSNSNRAIFNKPAKARYVSVSKVSGRKQGSRSQKSAAKSHDSRKKKGDSSSSVSKKSYVSQTSHSGSKQRSWDVCHKGKFTGPRLPSRFSERGNSHDSRHSRY